MIRKLFFTLAIILSGSLITNNKSEACNAEIRPPAPNASPEEIANYNDMVENYVLGPDCEFHPKEPVQDTHTKDEPTDKELILKNIIQERDQLLEQQ